jgi:hypothetical protein
MNDLNEFILTDRCAVNITRENDLNEFWERQNCGDRGMNRISTPSRLPNTNPGGGNVENQAQQIASFTKLIRSQFLLLKKERVMSCAVKCSVAFSVAVVLLAVSSVAEAGKKCAGPSVTTVALRASN